MEVYFWTFVVAVIVLLAGGVASLWQGILDCARPRPSARRASSSPCSCSPLVFEGSSLAVGYREYKRVVHGRHRRREGEPLALHRRLQGSQPLRKPARGLGCVIGIVIAAIGVLASVYLGALWADGAASLAIGVLLIADSFVIASATRSLVAGESAAPPVIGDITRAVAAGPQRSLVTDIKPCSSARAASWWRSPCIDAARWSRCRPAFDELRAAIRAVDERIFYIYFSIDDPHVYQGRDGTGPAQSSGGSDCALSVARYWTRLGSAPIVSPYRHPARLLCPYLAHRTALAANHGIQSQTDVFRTHLSTHVISKIAHLGFARIGLLRSGRADLARADAKRRHGASRPRPGLGDRQVRSLRHVDAKPRQRQGADEAGRRGRNVAAGWRSARSPGECRGGGEQAGTQGDATRHHAAKRHHAASHAHAATARPAVTAPDPMTEPKK